MTTFILYDSTNADDIPAGATFVAGYSDGRYNWPLAAWERFAANAWSIPITTQGGHTGARVADCETGDLTPQTAALWALMELHAHGRRPTIYTSASNRLAVAQALQRLGLALGADVDLWLASWGSPPILPIGCVAMQYAHPPGSGGHFDLSVVDPSWAMRVGNPPTNVGKVVTVKAPNGQVMTSDIGSLGAEGLWPLPPGYTLV